MKSLILSAAAAALTMFAAGSVSAEPSGRQKPSQSRCEWQVQPQYGPRETLRPPVCKTGDQRAQWTGKGGPECDPAYTGKTGHWVWRERPTYGPRATLRPPERVWLEAC